MGEEEEKKGHTFIHLDVDRAPPNIVLAGLLVDNALVFGTTASLLARKIDESTGRRDDGAFVANGIFVEESYGCVSFDLNAIHVEASLRKVLEILAHNWSMAEREMSKKRREADIQFE